MERNYPPITLPGRTTNGSVGPLSGILQNKTLKTDVNGKVIFLDKVEDGNIEVLQEENSHLQGTVRMMRSLDRSVRDNLVQLIEAWDKAIETVNRPPPKYTATSTPKGSRHAAGVVAPTETAGNEADLSSRLTLGDLEGDSMDGQSRGTFDDETPHTYTLPPNSPRAIPLENQRVRMTASDLVTGQTISSERSSAMCPSTLQDSLKDKEQGRRSPPKDSTFASAVAAGSTSKDSSVPDLNDTAAFGEVPTIRYPSSIQQRGESNAIVPPRSVWHSTMKRHHSKRSFYHELGKDVTTYRDLRRIVSEFSRWQRRHSRASKSASMAHKRSTLVHSMAASANSREKHCKNTGLSLAGLGSDLSRKTTIQDFGTEISSLQNEEVPSGQTLTEREPLDSCQLIGEVAFQLERRILAYIFRRERVRLEYSLSNIDRMIITFHKQTAGHLMDRKRRVLDVLQGCGLNINRHITLLVGLSEAYGTYDSLEETQRHARQNGWENYRILKYDVLQMTPDNLLHDVIVIIDCLIRLAKSDKKNIFLW